MLFAAACDFGLMKNFSAFFMSSSLILFFLFADFANKYFLCLLLAYLQKKIFFVHNLCKIKR